jgi:hypothetical protein
MTSAALRDGEALLAQLRRLRRAAEAWAECEARAPRWGRTGSDPAIEDYCQALRAEEAGR